MSISVIDIIGVIDNGVGAILSLELYDKIYEIHYWFSIDDKYSLVIEDKFYEDFPEVKDILHYDTTKELIDCIKYTLPNKEELFRKYGLT